MSFTAHNSPFTYKKRLNRRSTVGLVLPQKAPSPTSTPPILNTPHSVASTSSPLASVEGANNLSICIILGAFEPVEGDEEFDPRYMELMIRYGGVDAVSSLVDARDFWQQENNKICSIFYLIFHLVLHLNTKSVLMKRLDRERVAVPWVTKRDFSRKLRTLTSVNWM